MKELLLNKKTYRVVFVLTILAGVFATYWLEQRLWKNFTVSNGVEMLALYVGPFCSLFLVAYRSLIEKLSLLVTVGLAVGCCLLIQLPLYDKVFESFAYVIPSDGHLYKEAATYMFRNHTFCSYDGAIVNSKIGNHYLYQPGYKYYLAALLFLTNGDINRSIQWIGQYLIVITLAVYIFRVVSLNWTKSRIIIALLYVLLIVPALIKNMLMGITEWLAVLLLISFFICWTKRKLEWAYLFLGLTVFVRQNLLPLALFITIIDWISYKRMKPVLILAILLCLPWLHNWYYAGVFRYFADYSWWAERWGISAEEYFYESMILPHGRVYLQYIGIDRHDYSLANSFIGYLFIPFALVLFSLTFIQIARKEKLLFWFYGAVLFLLFLPTIAYNGSSCFPRFQLLNYTAFLMLGIVILERFNRRLSSHE